MRLSGHWRTSSGGIIPVERRYASARDQRLVFRFVTDLVRIASLYDAKGFSVTRKEELRLVFQQVLAADEFVVVDVILD